MALGPLVLGNMVEVNLVPFVCAPRVRACQDLVPRSSLPATRALVRPVGEMLRRHVGPFGT